MLKIFKWPDRLALRLVVVGSAVALAIFAHAGRCEAGFMVSITPPSATVTAGGPSVDFTVLLTADGDVSTVDIYGFNVRLELRDSETGGAPPLGIGFIAGYTPTSNYLFDGNSLFNGVHVDKTDLSGNPIDPLAPVDFPSPAINFLDNPLFANDNAPADSTNPFYITVSGPHIWKLGVVTVAADAFASGSFVINFGVNSSLDGKPLENGEGAPLDATFTPSGEFSIKGGANISPTPEPASAVLALIGGAGLLAGRLRRRAAAPTP